MPPGKMFMAEQFDTSRNNTLLGQPSNSRFSQLLSPGSGGGRTSASRKTPNPALAASMARNAANRNKRSMEIATRKASAVAAMRSGPAPLGFGSLSASGGQGGGGLGVGGGGRTVVTPNPPSAGAISGMNQLVTNYNKSFGAANKANEERYQQLLGLADQDVGQKGAQRTYGNMYSLAGRRGSAEMTRTDNSFRQMLNLTRANTGQRLADIRSDFGDRGADQQQQLARLGMGNTTVGNALSAGNQREMQSSLNRASDELSGREIGLLGDRQSSLNQLSESDQNRRLGIMERGQSSLSELAQRAQANKMGVIERRTDQGPSSANIMDILAGVSSQYGQGQGINALLQSLGRMKV